ncbi:hypothetical protein Q5A_003055 [Serratia inhibens PRI-2C]|nr:hypothetical protein Q5A_003055 [Serratia inhibens PRI-2C]
MTKKCVSKGSFLIEKHRKGKFMTKKRKKTIKNKQHNNKIEKMNHF